MLLPLNNSYHISAMICSNILKPWRGDIIVAGWPCHPVLKYPPSFPAGNRRHWFKNRFLSIKQIFLVIFHFELIQKFFIFFFKCLFHMMFLLIQYIIVDSVYFRLRIWKCSVSILPWKASRNTFLLIDEIWTIAFNIANQTWNLHWRFQTKKYMDDAAFVLPNFMRKVVEDSLV